MCIYHGTAERATAVLQQPTRIQWQRPTQAAENNNTKTCHEYCLLGSCTDVACTAVYSYTLYAKENCLPGRGPMAVSVSVIHMCLTWLCHLARTHALCLGLPVGRQPTPRRHMRRYQASLTPTCGVFFGAQRGALPRGVAYGERAWPADHPAMI